MTRGEGRVNPDNLNEGPSQVVKISDKEAGRLLTAAYEGLRILNGDFSLAHLYELLSREREPCRLRNLVQEAIAAQYFLEKGEMPPRPLIKIGSDIDLWLLRARHSDELWQALAE